MSLYMYILYVYVYVYVYVACSCTHQQAVCPLQSVWVEDKVLLLPVREHGRRAQSVAVALEHCVAQRRVRVVVRWGERDRRRERDQREERREETRQERGMGIEARERDGDEARERIGR